MAQPIFVTPERQPEQSPQQDAGESMRLTRIKALVVSTLTEMGAYGVLLRKHSPPLKSALWVPLAMLFAYIRPVNDFPLLFGGPMQFSALGADFLAGARHRSAVRSLGAVLLLHAACVLIAYRIVAR
jgi:hypothetical protein